MARIDSDSIGSKSSRRMVGVLLLLSALAGLHLGFRLPEERRGRALKLLSEAKELPFRLFV